MTHFIKFVCRCAYLPAKTRGLFNSLSIALFVLLIGASVSIGQTVRDSDKFRAVDFPYQAIVGAEPAAVYSGPDEVHYATDELPTGETVVVYRHDPNGWCAIQPPAGSFSLLPEAAVEKLSDGIGVLVQDQVQAWVGTRLGSVDKPLWQVKLRSDEEVEIIGEASWPSPDGHSTIWYQISPPAGEFRWVKIADLKVPAAASRSLPVDRNLNVDQRESRNAFTEVDMSDDRFVQRTASADDRIPATEKPTKKLVKSRPASGFVYRSEQSDSRKDPYSAPQPPELASGTESKKQSREPERDSSGINFHFRPVGKTAGNKADPPNVPVAAVEPPPTKHAEAQIDRINRKQNEVVQATFQSPRQPELAAPSRWRAAAKPIRSNMESAGNELVSRGFPSNSPDSLLPREPYFNRPRRPQSSNQLSPWETGQANGPRSTPSEPLAFQWDEQDDLQSPRRNDIGIDLESDQAIVGSPMFRRLSPQLSQIEMALNNEMLKRPNEWQLSNLELTVEQVYSQTRSPVERLQAQRILDKLKNCKKIRSGYAKSFQASGETFGTTLSPSLREKRTTLTGGGGLAAARNRLSRLGQAGQTLLSSTSPALGNANYEVARGVVGTGVDANVESSALYDAHGWLTELVGEDRNNRPVYVLVNDDGKITHHIAPSPGLNLHRYLKSKVGINGRQGYNNVLKLSHVTADNVSELIRR